MHSSEQMNLIICKYRWSKEEVSLEQAETGKPVAWIRHNGKYKQAPPALHLFIYMHNWRRFV